MDEKNNPGIYDYGARERPFGDSPMPIPPEAPVPNEYQPSPEKEKKKGSKAKVFIGVLLVLVVIAAAGYLVRGDILRAVSPKAYLAMAAGSTVKELNSGSPDSIFKTLQDIYAGSYTQTFGFDLNDLSIPNPNIPDIVKKAGLSFTTDVDRTNKKSIAGLKLRSGGATLLSANLFISNDTLALQLPELLDNYYSVPTADFVNQWNQSAISTMISPISSDVDISSAYDKIYGAGSQNPDENTANKLSGDLTSVFKGYEEKIEVKNGFHKIILASGSTAFLMSKDVIDKIKI